MRTLPDRILTVTTNSDMQVLTGNSTAAKTPVNMLLGIGLRQEQV